MGGIGRKFYIEFLPANFVPLGIPKDKGISNGLTSDAF